MPNSLHPASWRQVHLDFHTSEYVGAVGGNFDPQQFAATLSNARVQSVVLFAKCHHGWSYYDSEVGARHPGLTFDLLRAQVSACAAAAIATPIYLSVGWDERAARQRVDWRQVKPDGQFFTLLGNHVEASWKYLCLGSPYLDELCSQIAEVIAAFPETKTLWLDIIRQEECVCVHCQAGMLAMGLDWTTSSSRDAYRKVVIARYFQRTRAAADSVRPGVGLFHNTAMLPRGDRALYDHFSHLEVESVPTGGWGYDHLPMAAKYAELMPHDRLGITVRFHLVWGELGGYKHPKALDYELGAMLTHGLKTCIGDQMDPAGELDGSAYRMIGRAFERVEARERWCEASRNVADVALLSSVGERAPGSLNRSDRHCVEDEGAHRILSEGHILFDLIDRHADLSRYALIILPDRVRVDAALAQLLTGYLDGGGKVLLTGESGLHARGGYVFDVGADFLGPSNYNPTYILPLPELRPGWVEDPFVIMTPSVRLRATTGATLGAVYDPLFNRTPIHYNGHIHAPRRREPNGDSCGVRHDGITTLPHAHFTLYRTLGTVTSKAFVLNVIRGLLSKNRTVVADELPSTVILTLRHQPSHRRFVLHLLHGAPQLKGQTILGAVETIEDLVPIGPVDVELALPVSTARLVPDGIELAVSRDGKGARITVPRFAGHVMIEINT
jgi:hypothetical protein